MAAVDGVQTCNLAESVLFSGSDDLQVFTIAIFLAISCALFLGSRLFDREARAAA